MAELTIAQKRALAVAAAKKRAAEAQGAAPETPTPTKGIGDIPGFLAQEWGKYFQQEPQRAATFTENAINSVPIAGPLITRGVDEAAAQTRSAMNGTGIDAERSAVKAATENRNRQFGEARVAGQLTGTFAPFMAVSGIAAGQKLLGLTGSLLSRLGFGFGSGAVMGGGDTLARGGNFREALINAGVGGGLGSAMGATAPYVAKGMDAVGQRLARVWGARPKTPAEQMSRPAFEALSRALGADNALGSTGQNAIRAAGPRGMMADAGPSTMSLLDTSIARSGPASRNASLAVEERAAQAGRNVETALDRSLGANRQQVAVPGAMTYETALRKGTAPFRAAAYEEAYNSGIDYTSPKGEKLVGLFKRLPPDVIAKANRLMMLGGDQSKQIIATIKGGPSINSADGSFGGAMIPTDGSVQFHQMPDVRQLDYITRALNQLAKSGEGQGALGGQTDLGMQYSRLSRDLRNALKEAVPAYRKALEIAADPIQRREALLFGTKLMSRSVPRDVVAEEVGNMTGPEKQAMRQGVRSVLDEALANVKAVPSDPNIDARQAIKAWKDLSSPAARQKLRIAIGDDQGAKELLSKLDEAGQALLLRANVATNSRTYGRQAMDSIVSDFTEGGMVNQLMQGKPVNAVESVVQNITGKTPEGISGAKDKIYAEIADALTGPRGPQAEDLLSGIVSRTLKPAPQAPYLPGANSALVRALMDRQGIGQ